MGHKPTRWRVWYWPTALSVQTDDVEAARVSFVDGALLFSNPAGPQQFVAAYGPEAWIRVRPIEEDAILQPAEEEEETDGKQA